MHSPDDEAADSAAPFGGKLPPLFGGERSRSGGQGPLLVPGPLRTERAPFNALSSSRC